MKLQRSGPASFLLKLHAYELATLMAAARWAAEGGGGDLSPDALAQLRLVVSNYESELAKLDDGEPDPL